MKLTEIGFYLEVSLLYYESKKLSEKMFMSYDQ
ncbi:hypothetical protein GGGNBK_10665 [Sporosarcina sp. ANT_H38]